MRSLFLLIIITISSTALAICYFPNGGVVGSDTACNPNALVSACCFDNQACLSNGLCVSDPHDPLKARLHRGTCTDQAWKSGNCPRQCLDTNNNGVPVYSCNTTNVDSYCCYDNCKCASPSEVFSFNESPADVYTLTIIGESFTQTHVSTTSSLSPSAQSASTNTAVATSASTSTSGAASASGNGNTRASPSASSPTQTSSESTSSSKPAQNPTNTTAVGVGLGVGIPAAAILFAGAFFLWRRKKYSASETGSRPTELGQEEYYAPHGKYAHYADSEVHGGVAATELSAVSNRPVELPATSSPKWNVSDEKQ